MGDFLMIATRNAVLVFTISFSVLLVTFCFIAFYVIFSEKQKRLTMSGPLIMSSMDSLINSICVICLFRIGNKLYYHLCSFCDVGLKKVTIYIATKLLITKQSIPKQSFS